MDAQRYLDDIVVPTITEYAADLTSVRRGFLACVATFHIVDRLATGKAKDALRKRFQKECPAFRQVDRLAHAFKHTSAAGNLKTGDVVKRPPAAWGVAVWGRSRWGDAFGGVTLADDPDFDLLAELNTALAYLKLEVAARQSR